MIENKYNIAYDSMSQMEACEEVNEPMAQLIDKSLCANCKHQGDCMFLLRASGPILECELHECGLSSRPRLRVVKRKILPDAEAAVAEEAPLGLCGNCDNLKVCMLPKHPSGVWHCEEYS